jgi:hypothetical protein
MEIDINQEVTERYPKDIERGSTFYIKNIDQFRGKHFVIAYIQPELVTENDRTTQVAEMNVVDTSLNAYLFRDMGDHWSVSETEGTLTVPVPKDDIVLK